ncbi:hypothetical protein VNO77_15954 [Canavalia gladiata]|uniref:Uncharacterized protein n=1 Tax=Canavalia gladiata TaxID=3824 RepID=A0AAN9QSN6_CANGL
MSDYALSYGNPLVTKFTFSKLVNMGPNSPPLMTLTVSINSDPHMHGPRPSVMAMVICMLGFHYSQMFHVHSVTCMHLNGQAFEHISFLQEMQPYTEFKQCFKSLLNPNSRSMAGLYHCSMKSDSRCARWWFYFEPKSLSFCNMSPYAFGQHEDNTIHSSVVSEG